MKVCARIRSIAQLACEVAVYVAREAVEADLKRPGRDPLFWINAIYVALIYLLILVLAVLLAVDPGLWTWR